MNLSLMFNNFMDKKKDLVLLKKQNLNDKILIIDGMNSFIIQYSANPILNSSGVPVGGIIGFLNNLLSLIKLFKPTRVIIAFDGIKGSTKRKQMFKLYKQNRSASSTGIHYKFLDTFSILLCRLNMSSQLRRILDYLDCLPVTVVSKDYVEADDVIAYIANKLLSSRIIISSTDKDYLQLVNDRVTVWTPVKKMLYNVQKVKQLFNMMPLNFILYKSTVGDQSDNISGVKGVAIKTFNKLFPLLMNLVRSLDLFLNTIDTLLNGRKTTQTLKLSKLIIQRNFLLMQLSDSILEPHTQMLIYLTLLEKPVKLMNRILFMKQNVNDLMMNINLDLTSYLNSFKELLYFSSTWNNKLKENK